MNPYDYTKPDPVVVGLKRRIAELERRIATMKKNEDWAAKEIKRLTVHIEELEDQNSGLLAVAESMEMEIMALENRPHDEVLLHDMELMQAHIDKQDAEIKRLTELLHSLYFAGKWKLEYGKMSNEEEAALWQRVKDFTGWSVTDGKGKALEDKFK